MKITDIFYGQHNKERFFLLASGFCISDYSNLNVAEIAAQMGFRDLVYFSKFFRKFAGMPPSHYRRRYRIGGMEG